MTIETTGGTFKKIRARSVPLCAFESADPAHTINQCLRGLNGKGDTIPLCEWDIIKGLTGLNEAGRALVLAIIPQGVEPRMATGNPAECLTLLGGAEDKLLERAIVFWHQAHRQIGNEAVSQGFWNVRDKFKAIKATLVLLAPALILPPELKQDIMVVSEPLPDEAELAKIVADILRDAELTAKVPESDRPMIVDILRGLSAFAAEQVLYLSLTPAGVDKAGLWERKVKTIEQTAGLSVYRGKEKFEDVGGLDNAKKILSKTLNGKTRCTAICLLDELDKAMAASQSDTSGTTQDQNKVLLSYIQDNDVLGMLWLGPPGTGKTMLCKAAANEHGIPLIMLDLGAMKGSLVGESEQRMREAIKVVESVTDNRALFVGSCNRTENLPPELRRRFNYCNIFFDLPEQAERETIWRAWLKKYPLTPEQMDKIDDTGYTGSEIHNACYKAWAMDCKLSEAAATIVPISISAKSIVEAMRRDAAGKYISANRPGLFSPIATPQSGGGRKIALT